MTALDDLLNDKNWSNYYPYNWTGIGSFPPVASAAYELASLRTENERLTKERDLAIAHDTQPYPTAEAYEKVCEVLNKTKVENERLRKANEEARNWIAHVIKYYDEEIEGLCIDAGKDWLAANPEEE